MTCEVIKDCSPEVMTSVSSLFSCFTSSAASWQSVWAYVLVLKNINNFFILLLINTLYFKFLTDYVLVFLNSREIVIFIFFILFFNDLVNFKNMLTLMIIEFMYMEQLVEWEVTGENLPQCQPKSHITWPRFELVQSALSELGHGLFLLDTEITPCALHTLHVHLKHNINVLN